MSIEEVTEAIKNLGNNDDIDEPSSSQKVNKIGDNRQGGGTNRGVKSCERSNSNTFFCCEDTFLTKDVSVGIEGIGELCFPMNEKCIRDIIKISSKAKFGRGEETLTDTNVRDTQTIPANKLIVKINEQSLSAVLDRISSGLNIGKDSTIKPYLYNMLIYGPGQFFKKHQDSEKIPHMIATLVIVLPSVHKGGDLIIEHNDYKHTFFGSQNPSIVKCIAFYSDCQHEIEKVTAGYRVALTYNIVIESSDISDDVLVSKNLDIAVAKYFDGEDHNRRLIYLLNHSYTENNLKWSTLKGTDRTHANALLAVAKKQGLMPYLALADCQETVYGGFCCLQDTDDDDDDEENTLSDVNLYFWVDEHNRNPDKNNFNVHSIWSGEIIPNNEICYTAKTAKLFEPYKTKRNRYTGNEGASSDYWYKRACVVLFSSKWVFLEGFKLIMNEFHQLTTQKGNEDRLLEEINKAGNNFMKYEFWTDAVVAGMLIKIVIYLNNKEKAILILSKIPRQLLVVDKLQLFLQLETQYDFDMWNEVVKNWTKDNYSWQRTLDGAIPFIEAYKNVATKRDILHVLVSSDWSTLKGYRLALEELYQLTTEAGNVERLVKKINEAGENFFNYSHWSDPLVIDMLLKIVVYLNNPEKAVSILCRLLTHMFVIEKIEALAELGNQYDVNMWTTVMDKRRELRISDKKFSAEDSKMNIIDLIKFIDKFKYFAPNSVLIKLFVAETVNKYVSKVPQKNQSLRNKMDSSLIADFCLLLKTCIKAEHVTGKDILIDHAMSSYQPLSMADILFKLQKDLDPGIFNEYKGLKDHILKDVNKQIEKTDPNSWEIPLVVKCSCKFCNMVNVFLKSQTSTKIIIAASEKNRKHVLSNLNPIKDLIKTDIEKKGTPHKLIIEKLKKVLIDKQNLIEELNVCRTKLQVINFTDALPLFKTEEENILKSKILPQVKSESLAGKSIKVEDLSHIRIKTEPVDNVEHQNDAENVSTPIPVKIESEGSMELRSHKRVKGRSSIKIKSEPLSSIEFLANVKVEPKDESNDSDSEANILSLKRKRMSKK